MVEAANTDSVRVGDRVELHPATDAWMAGDRFGQVIDVSPRGDSVRVAFDRSGKIRKVRAANIARVVA
jgi:hypothetical protein